MRPKSIIKEVSNRNDSSNMRLTQDRGSYDDYIDVVNQELNQIESHAAKSPTTPTPLQNPIQEYYT